MKVTAVFLMCLFIKMSLSANLCNDKKCYCDYDKDFGANSTLTCTFYEGVLNYEDIDDAIRNVVFNGGIISSPAKETTSLKKVSRIEFSRCDLKNLKSLKMFKDLNDLNITQSEINLNLDLTGLSIASLDLSQCDLSLANKSALIKFFKQIPKLYFLTLVGNNFTEITDDLFAPLPELNSLQLDSCSIKNISPLLHFTNLYTFDVTNNNIVSLPSNLLHNSKHTLENLEVGKNPLESLSIDTKHFKHLDYIELENTNLFCDCKWLNNLVIGNFQPEDVECHNETTKDDQNSTWIPIRDYKINFCQSMKHEVIVDSNKNVVVVVAILLVLLIIAVFAFFGHKLLQVHRRRRSEKQQVKYSAVYKDTVEPSVPNSRNTIETKA